MSGSATARSAELAALAHQLVRSEHPWQGSPLAEDELEDVAIEAARQFDPQTVLKNLREYNAPAELLLGFLAVVWAAGFKVGAMLTEEQRP